MEKEMSEEARRKWDRRSAEFRQRALERMKTCQNVKALAKELGVARQQLYWWRQQAERRQKPSEPGAIEDPRDRRIRELEKKVAELEGGHRQEDAGAGFFRRCLAKDRGVAPEERQDWRDGIYTEIRG